MNPWNTDADVIKINIKDNLNKHIIFNESIHEYLNNIGENDNKYFIVAPKGYGKTLLLKAKSYKYRQKSGYAFIPEKSLLEKLAKSTINFTIDELNKYRTLEIWEDIWLLSLLILIIKNVDDENIEPEVNTLVGNAKALSDILYNVLDDRKNLYSKYKPLIHKVLLPQVREINFQVAVFIDNVDEAFDRHIGENYKRNKADLGKHKVGLSPLVWVYAQLGLISAVKTICLQNKHLKIFCSLRSEAFILDNSPAALIQNKNYTTELNYSKSELKDIFIKNIQITGREKLVTPDADDPIERFIGFTEVPHKYVKDSFGRYKKEKVFEYIWRHSFTRPREIVEMGKNINSIKTEERTVSKIRDIINETSYILLQQYKNEMVPYFREDVYDELCRQLERKIIKKEKAEEVSNSINEKYGFPNVFESLFRLGIIGWVERDDLNETKIVQKFLEAARYNFYKRKEIPLFSDYFLLHSSTDNDLRRYHGENYHDTTNIIGYDKEFYENSDDTKINHVHVGAGRISQCLIIPIINRNASIGIIQKPSNEWGDLSTFKEIELKINNKIKVELKVYHDRLSNNEKNNLFKRWQSKNGNVFFYTDDKELISKLFNSTEGISVIRRSSYSWLLDLIKEINTEKQLNLYTINLAKEDHKKMQMFLQDNEMKNICTIPIIADRYFYSKTTSKEGKKIVISNICEEFSEIVVYSKNKIATKLFYPNEVIEITKSPEEFRFHLKKYRLLSEGVFKLEKLLLHGKNNTCTKDEIYELFSNIQFHTLKEYIIEEEVKNQIFPNMIDSEIDNKMKKYVGLHKKRVGIMPPEFMSINNLKEYQQKVALQNILPDEEKLFFIFNKLRVSNDFDKNHLIGLLSLFNYKITKKISSLLIDNEHFKNAKIFVSYSHEDQNTVNEIDNSFRDFFGIEIIRDEKHLGYTEKIDHFMNQIKDADYAFVLITDSYLKSKYCLYELLELKKTENYLSKMLPIITDEKEIFENQARQHYYDYWVGEFESAKSQLSKSPSSGELKDLNLLTEITDNIKQFIDNWISMRLLSFDDLKSDNYLPILKILSNSN